MAVKKFGAIAALVLSQSLPLHAAVTQEGGSSSSSCSATDSSGSCTAPARRLAKENALLQAHQELDKVRADLRQRAEATEESTASAQQRLAALSAKAASHMRKYREVPDNTAVALSAGILAVTTAMPYFTSDPPQFDEGFAIFGAGLMSAISSMVPEDTRSSPEFAAFTLAWNRAVESLPLLVPGISMGLEDYRREGDIAALMRVWDLEIRELGTLVTQYLPQEIAMEVTRYLGALQDVLDGFDEAMDAYEAGNTSSAVESIYTAMRVATDELVSEELRNHQTYAAVMASMDTVFTDFSKTVLEYQQQLLSSSVCWKVFSDRERQRPSQCPSNHFWDGEHWCFYAGPSTGSSSQDSGNDASLLETSVNRKRPAGAIPARCDLSSEFKEKRGSWCYRDCPTGMQAAGARCKSSCGGNWPIDSPLMCGRSPGTVALALQEMAVRTLHTGMNAQALFSKQNSNLTHSMSGTIQLLIEMGKGFAHPNCDAFA